MGAIIDFLQGIAEGIKAGVEFLLSMIQDVAYVVELTAKFVVDIPTYLSWLPPEIVVLVVSIFAVVVIYKILGREG